MKAIRASICILTIIPMGFLVGCYAANSGAVPIGPDTFLISKQGSGFWVMPLDLRNEALKEANEYCSKIGKKFQVARLDMVSQIPLGQPGGPRFPAAEVQFMCLNPNDPELSRPKMQRDPDVIIRNN